MPQNALSFEAERNLRSLQGVQQTVIRALDGESGIFLAAVRQYTAAAPQPSVSLLEQRFGLVYRLLQYQINERATSLYAALDRKLLALDGVQNKVGKTKEDDDVRRLIVVMADCGVVEETIKSLEHGVGAVRKLNREINALNGTTTTTNNHHHHHRDSSGSSSAASTPATPRSMRDHNNNGASIIELPTDRVARMGGGDGGSGTPLGSSMDSGHSGSSQGGVGGGGGGETVARRRANDRLGGGGGGSRATFDQWFIGEAKHHRDADSSLLGAGRETGTGATTATAAAAAAGARLRRERYGSADAESAPSRSKQGRPPMQVFPESQHQQQQHEHLREQAAHEELSERMSRVENASQNLCRRTSQEREERSPREVQLQLQQLRQRYQHACKAWATDATSSVAAVAETATAGGASAGRAEARADRAAARGWGSEAPRSRDGAALSRAPGDADSPAATPAPSNRAFLTRFMPQGQDRSRATAIAATPGTATPATAAATSRVTPRRNANLLGEGYQRDGRGATYDDADGVGCAAERGEGRRGMRENAAARQAGGAESDRWAKAGFLLPRQQQRQQQQQQEQKQQRRVDPHHHHHRQHEEHQQQQQRKLQHQRQSQRSWQQQRAQQLYERYQEQPRQQQGVDVDNRQDLEMRQRLLEQREAREAYRSSSGSGSGSDGGIRAGTSTADSLPGPNTGRRDGNDNVNNHQEHHRQPIPSPTPRHQQQQQRPQEQRSFPNVGGAAGVSMEVLVRGREGEANTSVSAVTTSPPRSPSPEVRPLTAEEVETLRRRGRGRFTGSGGRGADGRGSDDENPSKRTAQQGDALPSASHHTSVSSDADTKVATRKAEGDGEVAARKAHGDVKEKKSGRCEGGGEVESGVPGGFSPHVAGGDKVAPQAGGGSGGRFRPVTDGPNSRPVTGADEQRKRWRPVKSDELNEQIKRARLDVESIGVPERAWKRGSGGWR